MSSSPSFDLLIRNAILQGGASPLDIGIRAGRIIEVSPAQQRSDAQGLFEENADGRLVLPGFVDTHIHLDKSCLLACCRGGGQGLKGAVAAVSRLKRDFTEEDVYRRGARTIEMAILQGTMHMRTHVEVDPRVGLRSFAAIQRLKHDYAFALDLSICVFPQEGLLNDPGTEALLEQALDEGADLLGGCPYTDSDPSAHMERIFAMARRHDVDLDFHLDFDLDPGWTHMDDICRLTEAQGWQGRVAIGHVTKLAAMDEGDFDRHAERLAAAGVAVTALPSTDLYLNGRDQGFRAVRGVAPVHVLAERGITTSIATNNVLNPFTPYGDCSLLRMANLYANLMHIGPDGFSRCLGMITSDAARLARIDSYGIAPGHPADLILLDATDEDEALASIASPLTGFKNGRKTFDRRAEILFRTTDASPTDQYRAAVASP
ncbi:amidohydrolase family protein [Rhizobium cremeum]|uniref:amidohydrolase family protein n=1 Tax=Rhizobium cremeum TaxID=2813827 RepID=UPI001FD0608E|nr:amidohydrolase family protein [Rhizobium cremeum]MCJ7997865.1 amidohydrolase family protein [Rhizobium cremeum]MCJ8002958.1 amidohydrolase family protein [Rhizobium cremeum]